MLFIGEDEINGVDNVEHGDDEEEPNEGVSQAYLWSHLVPMFVFLLPMLSVQGVAKERRKVGLRIVQI